MPSAAAIARSSGVVMKPRTRSALAPTYTVRTVTVALSSFGYWRTFKPRTACRPATMMSTLTTIASTGRRRKTSVSFMSPVRGVGVELWLALDAVVHDLRGVVAELERARAHHLLAGRETLRHRHEVAARGAHAYELLARDLDRFAVVRLVFDHEHGVAVGSVDNRGRGDRHHLRLVAPDDLHVDERPRTRLAGGLGDLGADFRVSAGEVDAALDGGDGSFQSFLFALEGHAHGEADRHLRELFLGQGEVHERSTHGVEGGHRRSRGQVLPHVDGPDAEPPPKRRAHDLALDLGAQRGGVGARGPQLRL